MNLTSGHPFWSVSNGLVASYPPLDQDLHCDCVVIGGGITGALVSYHLAEAGVNTVLLDKRDIGAGSTSGNTGLLQYEVDVPLRQLIHRLGRSAALRSYSVCHEALKGMSALVHRLHLKCGFEKKPSLQLARRKAEIPQLREEFDLRRGLGIPIQFWSAAELRRHFPFSRPAALFSENAGQVDPHLLTHGLLACARKRGLRVHDRTNVLRGIPNRAGLLLKTDRGYSIRARRAVVAAGFETHQFLRAKAGRLKSTYALVSEPTNRASPWYRESLIWETGLPYLYVRTLPDHRIILGGEDEPFINPTRRDALISGKARTLVQKFRRLFPGIPLEVAYAWAGTFGETKDGLPYIGRHPGHPHSYFVLGYGGNGVTYSFIAAEIIRDDFLGRKNPDARLFRFGR